MYFNKFDQMVNSLPAGVQSGMMEATMQKRAAYNQAAHQMQLQKQAAAQYMAMQKQAQYAAPMAIGGLGGAGLGLGAHALGLGSGNPYLDALIGAGAGAGAGAGYGYMNPAAPAAIPTAAPAAPTAAPAAPAAPATGYSAEEEAALRGLGDAIARSKQQAELASIMSPEWTGDAPGEEIGAGLGSNDMLEELSILEDSKNVGLGYDPVLAAKYQLSKLLNPRPTATQVPSQNVKHYSEYPRMSDNPIENFGI